MVWGVGIRRIKGTGGARPDMLVKGRTAIDAEAPFGPFSAPVERAVGGFDAFGCHFQIRIGRSIFLTLMLPLS